ncbi:TYW1 [Symbiodinium natans]|uniref:TYW1 protein n=1 Tax=Symbiodinium natans TaxID=878477 RepID=A0A812QRP0_9DINO|nr:TYW1 [Symbiodinium natans]
MISQERREKMERQSWQVVGSHSATKLCRWTKSMLQGKGGCYKHTFYGIASHRCMEHTPNVSCANKCVFCWRNHINPVAMDWKFDTDDPEEILEESLRKHYSTIEKQCLSPNALEARKEEARQVRHCALSLVGEPVAYPRIAEFVAALHRRRISSFLVTNGQFPEALRQLPRVTQLYLSCDAADRHHLQQVGRPLFKDFWERYLESMEILRDRTERTVCRLTLLRDVNMGSPSEWASLLRRCEPDFIEVKGVTMAGLFAKSGLGTMNMPTHLEVKQFAEALSAELPGYSLCCEHEHSNSALVASERFHDGEGWRTWIDFEHFADSWESAELTAQDYTSPTPDWALLGSPGEGFAPTETRKLRARPRPVLSEEKENWRQRWASEPKAVDLGKLSPELP